MSTQTVVVGIDQSAASQSALNWAADYARATGATLHVVGVHPNWHAAMPYSVGVAGVPLLDQKSWDDADLVNLSAMFHSVRPETAWRLTQVDGDPGPQLVKAAKDASLLVVGTREHTGFDRFLEGSVSHYCLRHSPVPVVAVPASASAVVETEFDPAMPVVPNPA